MIIGGLEKLTLIDFPDKLACTVFLVGCNFRCPWCYSSELVLPQKIKEQPKIAEKKFFEFLNERKDLLDGCVLLGGEPTINKDLPKFAGKIKKLGYAIKLDTNGSNPEMLKSLIDKKLIDYVSLDIKAPKEKYQKIVGRKINLKKIEKSVSILKENKIDYEFRTTVVPTLLSEKDILKIAGWISSGGKIKGEKYYLQNFRPTKTLDPKFENVKPYPDEYVLGIIRKISPFFDVCQIRG